HRGDGLEWAVVAVERHDALVGLLARLLLRGVERDDAAALAVRVDEIGEREVVGERQGILAGEIFTETSRGAHRQVRAALHDQHLHGAIAENLHDQRAFELEVRREQRASGHHFAKNRAYGRRILAAREHFLPGVGERYDLATHRRGAEHEFLQLVVHNL